MFYFFKDIIYLFLEIEEGREKERERNINQWLLVRPQMGTWPAIQACALTRNQTGDPLVCDNTEPTEPHQSGQKWNSVCTWSITRIIASATYKEPGRYHKWVHELGLQRQDVGGTEPSWRTCRLSPCGRQAPNVPRHIHFPREIRNGSTLC